MLTISRFRKNELNFPVRQFTQQLRQDVVLKYELSLRGKSSFILCSASGCALTISDMFTHKYTLNFQRNLTELSNTVLHIHTLKFTEEQTLDMLAKTGPP